GPGGLPPARPLLRPTAPPSLRGLHAGGRPPAGHPPMGGHPGLPRAAPGTLTVPPPPPPPANHPNGTGTAPTGEDPAPRASPAARGAFMTNAALAVAAVSNALMQALVVPAIGVLARDLDASPTAATWVLTAFLLASAILAPLLSSLGDRYGSGGCCWWWCSGSTWSARWGRW